MEDKAKLVAGVDPSSEDQLSTSYKTGRSNVHGRMMELMNDAQRNCEVRPPDAAPTATRRHRRAHDRRRDTGTNRHDLGYLLKKTRNGKWQKRWFETNGCFLTYYKKQGQKLLAALNLPQVGEILTLPEDTEDGPGLFSIELNERIYTIKAKSQEEATLWVEALVWRQKGGVVAQANGGKIYSFRVVASNAVADDAMFFNAAENDDDGVDSSPVSIPPVPTPTSKATINAIKQHQVEEQPKGCMKCCTIQ
ncbi:Aste57867_23754 [Aphanomyces stellatus]|uniref:Aste57867_23754 protein n=1 Tax=Aphanomyces stellatus TaxID=120398 RepID=A0A485LNH8_9STRA|nr:hypothetical protein As57867_023682 [Aphanomyces stellatus]VFU00399.1 Aste57867_23754 [Aphanomyces stellatus]